jgi:hypothetical protein
MGPRPGVIPLRVLRAWSSWARQREMNSLQPTRRRCSRKRKLILPRLILSAPPHHWARTDSVPHIHYADHEDALGSTRPHGMLGDVRARRRCCRQSPAPRPTPTSTPAAALRLPSPAAQRRVGTRTLGGPLNRGDTASSPSLAGPAPTGFTL